ncbi:tetraacyldisaccharide 4'-kinase [Inmirania thermothiophila]|nr:tetraacyldisaccharide 4'-kinase [Inmirania thermothiophila]
MALERAWYGPRHHPLALLLAPLGLLYCGLAAARRGLYRRGLLARHDPGAPVVVVGNLTVGGTGKTPLVAWIVAHLGAAGRRPGIVARGYGGRSRWWPRRVEPGSDPDEVGDEPVLLARRTGVPVWVGPDRVAAARRAVAEGCDVLVADDGLQHERLARRVEIAVVDGARGLGNRRCLPAGPLREPARRLREVDLVVAHGGGWPGAHRLRLEPEGVVELATGARRAEPASLGPRVHAVAGIGHPERFFDALRAAGLEVAAHPFPDHHRFRPQELAFGDGLPVLMTEKDAVKCARFARPGLWYVPVRAVVDEAFGARLLALLEGE